MNENTHNQSELRTKVRCLRRWFNRYVLFSFLFSASIFIMPFAMDADEKYPVIGFVVGALFWLALIGVIVCAVQLNSRRRKGMKSNDVKESGKLGLTHFFQNPYAIIVDILLFASILAFILFAWILNLQKQAVSTVGIVAFFFNMHCMLNGKCYVYIKKESRRAYNYGKN